MGGTLSLYTPWGQHKEISLRGDLPPRHVAVSADIFGCHNLGEAVVGTPGI